MFFRKSRESSSETSERTFFIVVGHTKAIRVTVKNSIMYALTLKVMENRFPGLVRHFRRTILFDRGNYLRYEPELDYHL